MPPKTRVTKDMIIGAAVETARQSGFEGINARTVSGQLHCSTQPVMYHFSTIDDLKKAAYRQADRLHTQYLMRTLPGQDPILGIGINYIRFAVEEPQLFRFLFGVYTVAAAGSEILGFAWNDMTVGEDADCEIVALYVRCDKRKSGIGRALFLNSMDAFRAAGKRKMIVWCLKENDAARKFYEKMGGEAYKAGTHNWGGRDYDMISYLYRLEPSRMH